MVMIDDVSMPILFPRLNQILAGVLAAHPVLSPLKRATPRQWNVNAAQEICYNRKEQLVNKV